MRAIRVLLSFPVVLLGFAMMLFGEMLIWCGLVFEHWSVRDGDNEYRDLTSEVHGTSTVTELTEDDIADTDELPGGYERDSVS